MKGNLSDILHRKFKAYRVSPLFNFSSTELKTYTKKLDKELNSKRPRNLFKAKINLNKNLRLNDDCPEALQVDVIEDELQRVYSGYFMSWKCSTPDENFTSLPILLVEGKVHVVNEVHSVLCKIFDCEIQPVMFSMSALIAFFVKLLEAPRNKVNVSNAQITLEYKIPECEDNDRIEIGVFLEATTVVLAVVMDNLREKNPGIANTEIISEFYNKLLNHIYNIFKIDFTFAELKKISFPDAFLTSDGQIQMSTDDSAASALNVLAHFTPLAAVISM